MQKNDIIIYRCLYLLLSTIFVTGLILLIDNYKLLAQPVIFIMESGNGENTDTPGTEQFDTVPANLQREYDNDALDAVYGITYIQEQAIIHINPEITKINSENVTITENEEYEYILSFSGDPVSVNRYKIIDDDRIISYYYNGMINELKISAKLPLIIETEYVDTGIIISVKTIKDVYDKILYLDAGHGGIDDGAVRQGYSEKDINLTIALMIHELFEKENHGIKVIMSRTIDEEVDRYYRAAQGSLMADAIVSIHCNTFTSTSVSGSETLYKPGQIMDDSRLAMSIEEFAGTIQRNLCEVVGFRDRGIVQRNDLALLNASSVPSVLVEVGYMSNPEELQRLTNPEYQRKIAQGVYNGIIEIFSDKNMMIKY